MSNTKHTLDALTDRALVKRYHALGVRYDKLNEQLLVEGFGSLRPSDMRRISDPPKLIRDFLAIADQRIAIRYEAERRYGPGLSLVDQLTWTERCVGGAK